MDLIDQMKGINMIKFEIYFRRTRTIRIPIPATGTTCTAAMPEVFHPADLGELPEQLRRKLKVPQAEPYTIVRIEEDISIGNF